MVSLLLLGSCGQAYRVPPGTLPPIYRVGAEPYGAWVSVDWKNGAWRRVAGELIAAEHDHLYVLSDSAAVKLPLRAVWRVELFPYEGELERFGSSGGGAIQFSRALSVGLSRSDVARLQSFSRFPAGIPAGVDPDSLRPRPRVTPAPAFR